MQKPFMPPTMIFHTILKHVLFICSTIGVTGEAEELQEKKSSMKMRFSSTMRSISNIKI